MIDFHTHILPGIDDGSRDEEESLKMLEMMSENGVDAVVATPHYYREEKSLEEFLVQRQTAFEKLKNCLDKKAIQIKLGAEVSFFPGMHKMQGIEKLCIEGTNYILVEMPFCKWDIFVIDELKKIETENGIVPIIAHIERYLRYKNTIDSIAEHQMPIQVNAEALTRLGSTKLIKGIRDGVIQFIGSDCHGQSERVPNVHLGYKKVEAKLGVRFVNQLEILQRKMIKF